MNILVLYESNIRRNLTIDDDLWIFCSTNPVKLEQALHSKTIHKIIIMDNTSITKKVQDIINRHVILA